MKHLTLFEDYAPLTQYTHPEEKFRPHFTDHNMVDIVELLRKEGYEDAYYGEKKDGTKFISGFGRDEKGMTPALFLVKHDNIYTFRTKEGAETKYFVDSGDVSALIKTIKSITVSKPDSQT
jgi:hypothetical protein